MIAVPAARDRELRLATAGLFGLAAVWPVLPVHPPFACPLRAATGIPCPFCGMTRACVAAIHGHITQSLSFNPAGILVLAIAALVLMRPSAVLRARPPLWALWLALGALWVWNIGFNPTFHQLLLRAS
jgi:hypothetical protein